jgi:branched-chain amino acid transport system substrate-binding protein
MRPIFSRNRVLYFYNEQYEGGVCDKNVFNTGVVPSQQHQALVPWAIENVGKRIHVWPPTTTTARSRPSGSSATRRRPR